MVREAKPPVVDIEASEPKAKESLIIIMLMVVLLVLTVVEDILFDFVQICKIWGSSRRWS